jgi:hypothetical protein
MIVALDKKVDALMQDNRKEMRNISQTVQSTKRDVQRLENIMTKKDTELDLKVEKKLEKSENRVLGPVAQLLDELRANPPAPVHVPVVTAFSSTAPYPPEPPANNSEWTTHDDYAPAEPNKPNYQENYEKHRQPVRLTCQFITS